MQQQLLVVRLLQRCSMLNQRSKVVQRTEMSRSKWLTDCACPLPQNRCVTVVLAAQSFSGYLKDPEMGMLVVVFGYWTQIALRAASTGCAVVALGPELVVMLVLISKGGVTWVV